MAFPEILGHDRVKALLERGLKRRRVPPSLLFTGPEGVGKKTLALTLGRALLCGREDAPCGTCPACARTARGIHPDLFLVIPATRVIKIDQIRELVREISGRPFEATARAIVIDDAHVMTEEASNALLKALEEPPATSHVMLVTSAPQGLLPTIRSRCQVLRLGPLPAALLEAHLRDAVGLGPEEAHLRAALSGGSLGAALAFESEAYRSLRDELLALLEALPRSNAMDRMAAADKLNELDEPGLALTALRSLLRDVAVLHAGTGTDGLLNADVAPRLIALSRGPLAVRAAALAEAAGDTRTGFDENLNRLLSFDLLMDALAG